MAEAVGTVAPRFEMRGVRKAFGSTRALDGVDFAVSSGEVCALVGQNGAGKSTLMSILSGALVPDSGEITVWARSEDEETYLTVDGQVGQTLKRDDRVVCRNSEHTLQLVRPPKLLFFDVLRQNLKWGER